MRVAARCIGSCESIDRVFFIFLCARFFVFCSSLSVFLNSSALTGSGASRSWR